MININNKITIRIITIMVTIVIKEWQIIKIRPIAITRIIIIILRKAIVINKK